MITKEMGHSQLVPVHILNILSLNVYLNDDIMLYIVFR